jgi:hypothetical protein
LVKEKETDTGNSHFNHANLTDGTNRFKRMSLRGAEREPEVGRGIFAVSVFRG